MYSDELILRLPLENGEEIDCVVLAIFEVDEREYIALFPMNEENGEILLYRYIANSEEEEVTLEDVNDDFEFERAVAAFDELMEAVSEE